MYNQEHNIIILVITGIGALILLIYGLFGNLHKNKDDRRINMASLSFGFISLLIGLYQLSFIFPGQTPDPTSYPHVMESVLPASGDSSFINGNSLTPIPMPTDTPPIQSISEYKVLLNAYASSVYETKYNNYSTSAQMVLDGDLTTAWNEGAKGNGVGEWIDLSPSDNKEYIISGFSIANGFQYHNYNKGDRYYKNNRVRNVMVSVDGKNVGTFELSDKYNGYETFIFNQPMIGTSIRFLIESVYPHDDGGFDDTCISEIQLK